jgi:hypothetical protein
MVCHVPNAHAPLHKFYVSNTIAQFNQVTGSLEITMKVFTDDLEFALEKAFGEREKIEMGVLSDPDQKDKFHRYFAQHFTLNANGRPLQAMFIGAETDLDLSYIYFEYPNFQPFNSLDITNDMFLELYEEQVNILHLKMAGWNQTISFDILRPEQVIMR